MDFESDEQRAEAIRRWLRQNGPAIVLGVVLGLGGIFGWQQWNRHLERVAEAASDDYQVIVGLVAEGRRDEARNLALALRDARADSPYATLAGLMLARLAMEAGDDAAAEQHLNWVVSNAVSEEWGQIARLRLARVQLALGRDREAEGTLGQVTLTGLEAEKQELLGDILAGRGQSDQARGAYEAARDAGGASGLIQFKLDNLTPPEASS